MRAGILSAGLWGLGGIRENQRAEEVSMRDREFPKALGWDLEEFEQEQVRGLVRQIFFPGTDPPVRQVVFSAIEPETDILPLCKRVGELVAAETEGYVAIVDESHAPGPTLSVGSELRAAENSKYLRHPGALATQPAGNFFWLKGRTQNGDHRCTKPLHLYLDELRNEFVYSIVAAPPAASSNEPFVMAHCADGIVLVLSAQRTRRVTALKVKDGLGGTRLLGAVLCEREFPIPWGIYRRL